MRRRSSQVEPTRRTTRGAGGTGGRTRGADARAKSADAAAAAGQRKGGAAPSPLLLLPLLRRLLLAPAPSAAAAAAHPPWFPGASQSVVRRLCWGEDRHGGIRPAGSLG